MKEPMIYKGVDIAFDPHAQEIASRDGTSTRQGAQPVDIVWRNLTFTVPVKAKRVKKRKTAQEDEKPAEPEFEPPEDTVPASPVLDEHAKRAATERVILQRMSGAARAGEMVAIMGSSGAGKTSLLSLLAGRATSGKGAKAAGEVFVNGERRDFTKFKKIAAYVLQDDDMFPDLTVQEQITYAALLRLPGEMSRERKLMRVEKVIQELGLAKVKDTRIGNQLVRGISGGERKRVNIATELVTDPALLFLDEPTTGLDSFNALNVMTSLRQLATNGRTVVSTIHQPRSSIFALFDQLLLLSEGRVTYSGPAKDALAYFSSLNFKSPSQFNPADFFMDLLSVDPRSPEREANTMARVEYLGDKYASQAAPILIEDSSSNTVEDGAAESTPMAPEEALELKDSEFQTSWWNEWKTLTGRSIRLAFRERAANVARLGQTVLFSIILGLIWLNNGREEGSLPARQSLVGVSFFLLLNQAFGGVFAVVFSFPIERSVVTRERASSMYRTSSYYISKALTDLPKTLCFNTIFAIIVYFMIGFKSDAGAFFRFLLTVFITSVFAESLAMSVSILTGDAQTSAAIVPVFVILGVLFGGFFLDLEREGSSTTSFIAWGKYLSFMYYAFNALAKNEFEDGAFSEVILEQFNNLSYWENMAALFGIMAVTKIAGYLFLQYLRAPKFLKF